MTILSFPTSLTDFFCSALYYECIKLSILQGKGKKRAVGWFPASYVKLLAGDGGAANGDSATEATPATTAGISTHFLSLQILSHCPIIRVKRLCYSNCFVIR